MAKNIQEKVEQIRQAVYGREVRESIASSIEAMNEQCEESAAGYQQAIADAESAVTAANSAATQADTAAGAANDAADRANEAAAAVEGLDVSQLVQKIQQLTPEFLKVWDCPDGDARLELWAAGSGGMVEYYAVLNGTFSKDTYSNDTLSGSGDGEMVNLFEADPKFLPELSDITDGAQSVTFNGIIGVNGSKTARINLVLISSEGTSVQTVSANLTGYTLLNLGTVIPLGRVKSQAYQG